MEGSAIPRGGTPCISVDRPAAYPGQLGDVRDRVSFSDQSPHLGGGRGDRDRHGHHPTDAWHCADDGRVAPVPEE